MVFGDLEMRIYSGKSPPQAEIFGDFGALRAWEIETHKSVPDILSILAAKRPIFFKGVFTFLQWKNIIPIVLKGSYLAAK